MATFQAQVEGLTGLSIGTSPTTGELTEFLKDGVLEITNRIIVLKPQEIENFQRTTSSDSQGVGVGGAKIISVIREANADGSADGSTVWRACRKAPSSMQSRVVDIDSLHYASIYNPVYIRENNNTINVYPVPSANNGIKVFYVNEEPRDITNDASLDFSHSNIKYFPNDKVYLVVLYASMKSLLNAMSAETLPSDLNIPVLGTYSESLPTFTAPDSFVLPPSPAGVDVDFSNVGSIESFVSPVFALESKITITDLSISTTIPVPPVLDSSSINTSGLTNPTFTPPIMSSPDWSDTNTWISTEEDSEMSAARVQEIQGKVAEYSARIQEAQAVFNKESAILSKDLQIAMQNATSHEQGKLSKYSSELQSYQAEVNKEVQEWQANSQKDISLWTENNASGLQKYQADIQKETARISSSLQDFQAEVGKAIQEYQSETGYDMSKYTTDIQASINKYQSDLTKNQTTFETSLSKYNSEIQKVTSDNQSKIGKFNAEIQDYASRVNKINTNYQWMQGRYGALKQQYDEAFMMMAPKQQQQQEARR